MNRDCRERGYWISGCQVADGSIKSSLNPRQGRCVNQSLGQRPNPDTQIELYKLFPSIGSALRPLNSDGYTTPAMSRQVAAMSVMWLTSWLTAPPCRITAGYHAISGVAMPPSKFVALCSRKGVFDTLDDGRPPVTKVSGPPGGMSEVLPTRVGVPSSRQVSPDLSSALPHPWSDRG